MMKPVFLDYLDFQKKLPEFVLKVKNILKFEKGACIIKNFPVSEDNSALLLLRSCLGESIHEPRNIEGKSIYKVEVNENLEIPTYANTSFEFLCHTDCSEFDNPPDTVIMLCEKQSKKGGHSYLVRVEDIIKRLTIEDIMQLSSCQFPFGNKLYPILEYQYDHPVMRYNRISLDSFIKFYLFNFEPETLETLDKLDAIIDQLKLTFKLKEGECLIINNKTLLHGRRDFQKKSKRLIKRLRLNLK